MGEGRGNPLQKEPENSEEPESREIILYRRVSRFIERKLQPKVAERVFEVIERLKDSVDRTGSVKIQGRPANDPMFRIEIGNYRVFYKRINGNVHVVDMENRGEIYDKGRTRRR